MLGCVHELPEIRVALKVSLFFRSVNGCEQSIWNLVILIEKIGILGSLYEVFFFAFGPGRMFYLSFKLIFLLEILRKHAFMILLPFGCFFD